MAGRVAVNGAMTSTLGVKVDPETDRVTVDGVEVGVIPARWLLLHKPTGVVTTATDPQGRPTVYDLLPPDSASLRYVGRLDVETEGLLILTNQGDVAETLLHPRYQVEREYQAWVEARPDPQALERLREGVLLEDGPARVLRVAVGAEGPDGVLMTLVVTEGRKREVRRLLFAVGHPVRRLRRIRFGPLSLGDLAPGAWRRLDTGELEALEALVPKQPLS